MSVRIAGKALAAAILLVAVPDADAVGQSARADGKAFAAELAKRAQAAAKAAPNADRLPGYDANHPHADLFDNPDAMGARASAAAAASDAYRTVRESIDRRPSVSIDEIEATIARGTAISDDPLSYVSGMAIEGGQGQCRELPPSTTSAGYYEATCNVGVALDQSSEACTVPLVVSVTKSTRYRYWCSGINPDLNEVDECRLFDGASCTTTGQHPGRCLQGTPNNCTEPGEPVRELLCDEMVPGAALLGTVAAQAIDERRDESACAGQMGEPACALQSEVCTSSEPVTRAVDGISITRPCWAWERAYQCNRTGQANDCAELDGNAACSFVREDCLTEEVPCPTVDRVYRCPLPPAPSAEKQFICDGDIYCIGGECETIDRQPNAEFRDAVVALNAAAQAGREFDADTLSLFKGERETCRKKVFGLLNCCAGKAFPLIPGANLLVALGCNSEELLLHQRDATGLCAYVGSYCSDSVLGICVTKKKVYCCFESKLSRILQEQGRPQLNKPWDKPKRETCQGFSIEEFARLDLSRMDFSEVYAEFQGAAKLPEELGTVETMQQKIADYYAIHGSGR